MRLVFDGFWWNSGPPSGRMILREMTSAWAEHFPQDEIVLAVPRGDTGATAELPGNVLAHGLRSPQHAVSVVAEIPRVARRYGADVSLCQNFTPVAGASVTFVHDVLFQSNPEWFTRAERAYLAPVPLLARRAKCLLTSSHAEAARIRQHNPHLGRVVPVGLAAATRLTGAQPIRPPALGPADGFLLSVGRLNIRKNLGFALEAAEVSGILTPRFPFVVVGEADGKAESLSGRVRRQIERGAIVFLGGVSDAELAWLYLNADLFVFFSLDEGFGLPPVEAQAFGCPVLVSDIPVMREVCSEGAQFVGLGSADLAAQAILGALLHAARGPSSPGSHHSWHKVVQDARTAVAESLGGR